MDPRRTRSTACTSLSARLEVSAQNRLQELKLPSPEASCPEYYSNDCVIMALWPYDQKRFSSLEEQLSGAQHVLSGSRKQPARREKGLSDEMIHM